MGTNNAINLNEAGVVSYDGVSAFTASTLTQYNSLVGGASNAIVSVAPSATSGVPLCSNGASSNPSFQTCAIAGGGTNATSFAQSNGVVTYNGTSLVNYAGPQISSGGVYTNSTQPSFYAYPASNVTAVTGDGTTYAPVFGDTLSNVGTNYNTSTGVYTAPVTGFHIFTIVLTLTSVTALNTSCLLFLNYNSGSTLYFLSDFNIGAVFISADTTISASIGIPMNANDTVWVAFEVSGNATKNVGILAPASSTNWSSFSGILLG